MKLEEIIEACRRKRYEFEDREDPKLFGIIHDLLTCERKLALASWKADIYDEE